MSRTAVATVFGLLVLALPFVGTRPGLGQDRELKRLPDAQQRWEYLVLDGNELRKEGRREQDALNKLGKAGWELVFVQGQQGFGNYYFKRPTR
jgi:hypothetical protein